jgi:hypothetical protein
MTGQFPAKDPSYVHHPLTLDFLARNGNLRAAVEAFAGGANMTPDLALAVSKLRFVPVVERSIESKHSLISRRVQKNYRTGRVISLTLRVPEIKDALRRDVGFLQELVDQFARLRRVMLSVVIVPEPPSHHSSHSQKFSSFAG